jgi:RecJ-like exonuclease
MPITPYLTKDDPDAFLDHVLREPYGDLTKICPVCKGYGGWNLRLNAYPLNGKEDTAENRHKFSHFRCSCSHCNGWGYVHPKEDCVGHTWQFVKNTGNCLNLYKCALCGKLWEIDSSG